MGVCSFQVFFQISVGSQLFFPVLNQHTGHDLAQNVDEKNPAYANLFGRAKPRLFLMLNGSGMLFLCLVLRD